jgi:di/tricarboxylate transporter
MGFGAFGLFEFSLIGLIVMAVGVLYLFTVGRKLLPNRDVPESAADRFKLKQYLSEAYIPEESSFIGKTLAELKLTSTYDLEVLEIIRGNRHLRAPLVFRPLAEGDQLIIRARAEDLAKLEILKDITLPTETTSAQDIVGGEDTIMVARFDVARVGFSQSFWGQRAGDEQARHRGWTPFTRHAVGIGRFIAA